MVKEELQDLSGWKVKCKILMSFTLRICNQTNINEITAKWFFTKHQNISWLQLLNSLQVYNLYKELQDETVGENALKLTLTASSLKQCPSNV